MVEASGSKEAPEIKLLGNALFSQAKLHEKYGGVYPTLAKREHEKNLPHLLEKALRQAQLNVDNPDIDCVAVTVGPGLEPALWTGITFAEALGKKWSKPVLGINHMEGHVWSVLFQGGVELPALAMLVSGGHTELVYAKDFKEYKILGKTLDDAAGEAFDKVARMLGLPYPGGPEISKLAKEARENEAEFPKNFSFPRPMLHSKNLNFSFSGLKTAVLYKIKEEGVVTEKFKREVAREFEDAVAEVLVEKTRKALDELGGIKSLILAGGVAANTYLRLEFERLAKEREVSLLVPTRELATDNAVMIALAAFVGKHTEKLTADGNLSISS